jgi:hypothetical protein
MILRPEGRHPRAAQPKSCGEVSLDPFAYSDVVPYLFSEATLEQSFSRTSTIEQSGSDLVDSLVPVGRQTACRHDGVSVYGAGRWFDGQDQRRNHLGFLREAVMPDWRL